MLGAISSKAVMFHSGRRFTTTPSPTVQASLFPVISLRRHAWAMGGHQAASKMTTMPEPELIKIFHFRQWLENDPQTKHIHLEMCTHL